MKTIRVVAILLILFAAYNIWVAMTYAMPLLLLWVVACSVAAYGVWRERPWSRWPVYVIAVLSIASILANIILLAMSGWPLAWPAESLMALTPAVLAIAAFGWMLVVTYQRFRRPG